MTNVDALIIGGGPSGISASIWCKRLAISHLLIEQKDELGGQLEQIKNKIIDYPGIVGGAGEELKARFIEHIEALDCNYLSNVQINNLNIDDRILTFQKNGLKQMVSFKYLLLATGASARALGVSGESEMIDRGESFSASKDADKFKGKNVVVIGGGDRALEGSIILANSGVKVTLIHRSQDFRARDEYVKPAIEHPNISLLLDTEVIEILGNEKVNGVRTRSKQGQVNDLAASAVFIRIGIKPNSELVRKFVGLDERGYITTDSLGKTSHDSIYAIGDVCTQPEYSSISSAVADGMRTTKHISLLLQNKGGNK